MTVKLGTLFSGIGSPEFALKSLRIPHKIEFACDNDVFVKQTYLANHTCKLFYEDVKKIDELPKVDLLVFGFPCQPFSFAGHKEGLQDDRGKLIFNTINLIKKSRPKTFIAENVEGLLEINEGKTFDIILKNFKKIGYKIEYKILNSIDFGIPQNRRRLWIVGTLKGDFVFSKQVDKPKHLSDFLDKQVEDNVFATESFLSKPKVKDRIKNYKKPYINCITQTIGRNGSSSEYISYVAAVYNAIKQTRKPTVKECCRLFDLPDNFYFPPNVSITRQYSMLANSMVVTVLKSLIKNII